MEVKVFFSPLFQMRVHDFSLRVVEIHNVAIFHWITCLDESITIQLSPFDQVINCRTHFLVILFLELNFQKKKIQKTQKETKGRISKLYSNFRSDF